MASDTDSDSLPVVQACVLIGAALIVLIFINEVQALVFLESSNVPRVDNCSIHNSHLTREICPIAPLRPEQRGLSVKDLILRETNDGETCIFSVCSQKYNSNLVIAGDLCCRKPPIDLSNWLSKLCEIRSSKIANSSRLISWAFMVQYRQLQAVYANQTFGDLSANPIVRNCCQLHTEYQVLRCLKKRDVTFLSSLNFIYNRIYFDQPGRWDFDEDLKWLFF